MSNNFIDSPENMEIKIKYVLEVEVEGECKSLQGYFSVNIPENFSFFHPLWDAQLKIIRDDAYLLARKVKPSTQRS